MRPNIPLRVLCLQEPELLGYRDGKLIQTKDTLAHCKRGGCSTKFKVSMGQLLGEETRDAQPGRELCRKQAGCFTGTSLVVLNHRFGIT